MLTATMKIYLPSQFLITLLLVTLAAEVSVAASSQQESTDIISSLITTDQLTEKLNTYRDLLPNDPDSIINNILPYLEVYEESEDPEIAARANWLLGVSYYFKGEYILSNYYYDQVLLMDQAEVSPSLQASIHNNKGVNYELLGKLEVAIDSYRRSFQIENGSGNVIGKAQTEMNMGILLNKIGELDRAIEKTERALAVFTEQDDPFHVALASMNLGTYYSIAGKEPALELLTRAKEGFEELGSDRYVTTSQFRLARYFTKRGDYEKAIEQTTKTLKRLEGTSFTDVHIRTLTLMISLQDLVGNTDQSIRFIEKVIVAVEDELISAPDLLMDFWELATRIYSQSGKATEIADLISTRSSFEESVKQQLNLALLNQFEILNDISPNYASEVAENYPDLGIGSYKLSTFFLLILVIVFISLSAFIYIKLNNKLKKSENELRKIDYLVEKLKNADTVTMSEHSDFNQDVDSDQNSDSLFVRIENYLVKDERFLDSYITREHIAKELHTNVKYVTKEVKANTGLSYSEYMNQMRVAKAIKIMREKGDTISNEQLSEDCGYSSTSSFYRNFKTVLGVTPNKFKEKLLRSKKTAKSMHQPPLNTSV